MKSFLNLILSSFLFFSCAQSYDIVGNYETAKYNYVEIFWKNFPHKTGFVVGASLNIKEDSTFLYQTCATIMTGSWSIEQDSLILDIAANRWRSDNLHKVGFHGEWSEAGFKQAFKISNAALSRNTPATLQEQEI